MYIKATITSQTGRFRCSGFLTADGTIQYGIEFNSPHTVHWQYTNPIELNIVAAYDTGHTSMEYRTAMRDAGRGRLLP